MADQKGICPRCKKAQEAEQLAKEMQLYGGRCEKCYAVAQGVRTVPRSQHVFKMPPFRKKAAPA